MMKFDVLNRYTGNVQFTAEIEAEETSSFGVRLGLAVKWAIKYGADFSGANLSWANLRGADLSGANLSGADLRGADFSGANLSWANLRGANLSGADLSGADLSGANLSGANLSWANSPRADFSGADLSGANLRGAIGNLKNVKSMQIEDYSIVYTDTDLFIGCEKHPIFDWWKFDDAVIEAMDGEKALIFWKKWKPVLMNIIEMSPAEPTGAKKTK